MDSNLYAHIYFVICNNSQSKKEYNACKIIKKRRGVVMTNELVKRLIGKRCTISTGSMGSTFKKAKILNVVDNWISVEINGREDLINVDYVQYIKVVD